MAKNKLASCARAWSSGHKKAASYRAHIKKCMKSGAAPKRRKARRSRR